MNAYRLIILSPEKTEYEGTVVSLNIPCENGRLTVLAGHAPMVAAIAQGVMLIGTEEETLEGKMESGILKVSRNEAVVLAHSFEWTGEQRKTESGDSKKTDENTLLM